MKPEAEVLMQLRIKGRLKTLDANGRCLQTAAMLHLGKSAA